MAKYNPDFWEVAVDPSILDSIVVDSSQEFLLLGEEKEDDSAEKQRLKKEALEQLRVIVKTRLTERQKEIVDLYYFKEKSQAEIAEELGIAQQVVSKHLFGTIRDGRRIGGAIEKLRKICDQLGMDPKKWV